MSEALHLCHLANRPWILLPFMSSAHSPNFPSLHLLHSSFSNPSVALPMSQLILQPFRCFTYVTAHSPILLSLLLCHRLFTYVTWRATHVCNTNLWAINQSVKMKMHRNFSNASCPIICLQIPVSWCQILYISIKHKSLYSFNLINHFNLCVFPSIANK